MTGHRDLQTDDLREIIAVFRELDKKYPYTPIVVLSPLAEGADRLVAKAALAAKRRDDTYPTLICPLPMEIEEYKNDFMADKSKDEFDYLLGKAAAYFELEPEECGDIKNFEERRACLYKNVGTFISRHSHILIAIWDGENKPEKPGGTLQIVKMRHEGILDSDQALPDEIDAGPIFHFLPETQEDSKLKINLRRKIFPGMDLFGCNCQVEPRAKASTEAFNYFLERLDALNSELKGIDNHSLKSAARNRSEVFPDERLNSLNGFSRQLLDLHSVADFLAMDYQYFTSIAVVLLFVLAFLALFCFEIYAHALPHWIVLLSYPIVLCLGFFLVIGARFWNIQNKYLYFRALAESLRVQFFLRLSGNKKIDYPVRGKDELNWLESASRTVAAIMSAAEFEDIANKVVPPKADPERIDLVLKQWVKSQETYFEKLSAKYGSLLKKRHRQIAGFFIVGPILAVLLVLLEIYGHHDVWWFKAAHAVLVTAIGTSLALAATIGGHTGKTAIATKAERCRWMGDLFRRYREELERRLSKGEIDRAGHLVFRLCEIAMEENADWLLDGLEREIEVPKG